MARAQHAAAGPRAPRLRRRAQDRRPLDRPPVRERRARARGDAGRRDARRGRHRERPHHPHGAAAHRRRVAARGPGRGLLLEEGVCEGQRGAGGRGRAALRQPAQRRRGNDAPARLAHHGEATPRRLALRRRRRDAHAGRPRATPSPASRSWGSRSTLIARGARASRTFAASSRTGARSGTSSASRPTASSSRSTTAPCSRTSARPPSRRAGRSPTSTRPRRRRRWSARSGSTWAAPGP